MSRHSKPRQILDSLPSTQRTGQRVLVNTGALAGSNLWRIVVSFVLVIMVKHWLGAAAVGQYTIALAYLNVCQVLSELGLQTLFVRDLAQSTARRRAYFFVALRLQLLASVIIWAGLYLFARLLPYSETLRVMLWLVGASLPFYAITSICQTLFQAGERMTLVMSVEMVVNTLILGISLGALWLGGDVVQLAGVIIVTQAVSAGLCLLLLMRSGLIYQQTATHTTEPLHVRRIMGQALPFLGLALADVLLQRLDILLLSLLASETITGIYSLAYNVVRVLLKLIQSYWKALYPTLSRLIQQEPSHYERLSSISLRYGLFVLLLAAAIGTGVAAPVLDLIYGDDAADVVPVLRILLWSAPFFLLETYFITALMVERRPQVSLLLMGLHLSAVAINLPLLTTRFGAVGAAIALVTASALSAGVGAIVMWSAVRPRRPASSVGIIHWHLWLASILASTFVATLAATFLPIPWLVRAILGSALFGMMLWQTGTIDRTDIALFRSALGRNHQS